jgi:hypothetical protein
MNITFIKVFYSNEAIALEVSTQIGHYKFPNREIQIYGSNSLYLYLILVGCQLLRSEDKRVFLINLFVIEL